MKSLDQKTRKVTMNLPIALLEGLVDGTHGNLTEIVRDALTEYRRKRACDELLKLRGKVKFSMTWQELRDKDGDRDLTKFLSKKRKKA